MDIQKLISDANEVVNKIAEIKNEHDDMRKKKKENFNFFSAIVSGKNNKEHIEKYHSNFIAYLLNSHASHDFEDLFLKCFFEELKKKFTIDNLPNELAFTIERERQTTGGRFIDISLELGTEWIVFIENKIWSGEQEDQMKDYCDFAEKNFKNGIGIYLTPNGFTPNSLDILPNSSKIKVVCLSYLEIIQWLKRCHEDQSVKKYQHVVGALKQYITVIENLIKTMKQDTKEIQKYLKQNKDKVENIIINRINLNEAIQDLVKEVRGKFKEDLEKKINKRNVPENLKIFINQGDYLFSGDEDKSYGLSYSVERNNEKVKVKDEGSVINAIEIEGINAHFGQIEEANAILVKFYETDKWDEIVEESAIKIVNEVLKFADKN